MQNNAIYTWLKIIIWLFVAVLVIGFLANNSSDNKSSKDPIAFVKKTFNVHGCDEFLPLLDGEVKKEFEKEIKERFADDLNKCNKDWKENVENWKDMQCREIDKKDFNPEYIEPKQSLSDFSNIVFCKRDAESEEESAIFLSYDELGKTYKIVNLGKNIEKEVIAKRKGEKTRKQEIESRKNTTNPAYLNSSGSFVIDLENEISNLPEDNKSVWVEEVVDENTIKVSYIILRGGENFITFATIDLYGLSGLSGCYQEKAVKFLKQFIEHKYVYLSGGYDYFPKDDYPDVPKKFLVKYVKIWRQDIDAQEEVLDRLYDDKRGEAEIEVNTAMIRLGYAQPVSDPKWFSNREASLLHYYGYYARTPETIILRKRLENEQEVAKVAKRGFWGICRENSDK